MRNENVAISLGVYMDRLEQQGADPKVIALSVSARVMLAAHDEGGGVWKGLWVLVKSYRQNIRELLRQRALGAPKPIEMPGGVIIPAAEFNPGAGGVLSTGVQFEGVQNEGKNDVHSGVVRQGDDTRDS